jgi:hypothetical protein
LCTKVVITVSIKEFLITPHGKGWDFYSMFKNKIAIGERHEKLRKIGSEKLFLRVILSCPIQKN